jgi:hypothetical protein
MSSGTKDTGAVSIVGQYVDGLQINIYGVPRQDAFNMLKAEKKPGTVSDLGVLSGVPGGPLKLRSNGRGRFPYVVENRVFDAVFTAA